MTTTHGERPPTPDSGYREYPNIDTAPNTNPSMVPSFVPAKWSEPRDTILKDPDITSVVEVEKPRELPRASGKEFRATDAFCLSQLPPDIAEKMEVVWVKDGGEKEPVEAWRAIALEGHILQRLAASRHTLREERAYAQHGLEAPIKILPTLNNIFKLAEAEDRSDTLAPYSEVIASKCREWFEKSIKDTPSDKDTLRVALLWYETQRNLFTRPTAARLTHTAPDETVHANEYTLNGERYRVNNDGETVKVDGEERVIASMLNDILQKAEKSVENLRTPPMDTSDSVHTPTFGPIENPGAPTTQENWAYAVQCYDRYKQDVEQALQEIEQVKLRSEEERNRRPLLPTDY